MKNQEFWLIRQLADEEVRNRIRRLADISEDCEPTKMKAAGKTTVLQSSPKINEMTSYVVELEK